MYPDAAFSKLIITCSYNVCGAEKEAGENKERKSREMEKVSGAEDEQQMEHSLTVRRGELNQDDI